MEQAVVIFYIKNRQVFYVTDGQDLHCVLDPLYHHAPSSALMAEASQMQNRTGFPAPKVVSQTRRRWPPGLLSWFRIQPEHNPYSENKICLSVKAGKLKRRPTFT